MPDGGSFLCDNATLDSGIRSASLSVDADVDINSKRPEVHQLAILRGIRGPGKRQINPMVVDTGLHRIAVVGSSTTV